MSDMVPLCEDPCFTFRFAEVRIVPQFHLVGVEAGQRVSVFKIDSGSGKRLRRLPCTTLYRNLQDWSEHRLLLDHRDYSGTGDEGIQ